MEIYNKRIENTEDKQDDNRKNVIEKIDFINKIIQDIKPTREQLEKAFAQLQEIEELLTSNEDLLEEFDEKFDTINDSLNTLKSNLENNIDLNIDDTNLDLESQNRLEEWDEEKEKQVSDTRIVLESIDNENSNTESIEDELDKEILKKETEKLIKRTTSFLKDIFIMNTSV